MKCSYVNLLYGDNIYFIGTLIFVLSLLKTKPKHDIVLCYTFDVPQYKLDILKKYYTKMIKIEYIRFNQKTQRKRFQEILTKLQIFTLIEYDKIMYLDNDMFVRKNIDHLFNINCPAGMAINPHLKYKNNQKIKDKNIIINAGLLLLNPNLDDYTKIRKKIKYYNFSKGNLEQEFLSKYYNYQWTNISYLYNYQFGLAGINNNSIRTKTYKKTSIKEVYNIHYSSPKKPWDFLVNKNFFNNNFFKNNKEYIEIWLKLYYKTYKFYKNKGININNLYDSYFKNIEKYIESKYTNLKKFKLANIQIEKLNKKLNKTIPNSSNNNNNNFSYKFILDSLQQLNIKIFIVGGCIRDLFNKGSINDIDTIYIGNNEIIENKFKSIKNLKFLNGEFNKKYFRIGNENNKEMELTNIDFFLKDTLDSCSNMLMYDYVNNILYDLTGYGVYDSINKIFRKPPYIDYDTWFNCTNTIILRIYKFIKKKYKIPNENRIHIYNDVYFNNKDYFYWYNLRKKIDNDFYSIIKKDVDSLNLKYSGEEFINHIKNQLKLLFKMKF